MALKYAVKLIFLKCAFKLTIKAAPPASNSVYDREICFKSNNFNQVNEWMNGGVAQVL